MYANIDEYRRAAQRFLPHFAFAYLDGGCEDGLALQRNRAAYSALTFRPRTLVDVTECSPGVTLGDRECAFPAIVGPTGLNGLYRPRAEETLAMEAHRAGLPFVLSTVSTSLLEDVRRATDGDLWFQLYVQRDRRISEDLMARALGSGYSTLILTVDTPVTGKRDHYRRLRFNLPIQWTARLVWDVLTHPRWLLATAAHGSPTLVNVSRSAGVENELSAQVNVLSRSNNMSVNWRDIDWLRSYWPGRLLIKGVMSVDDALRAREHGADGVVVSNHGGRQLDGLPSPLDVLPEVVDAVGRGFDVLVDSGVRRGSDIAKAVALGARAVLVGRAPLYGLAASGAAGVRDVLSILREELEICLRLLGCPDIRKLDDSYLRIAPHRRSGEASSPAASRFH
jgi:(S)-mandelate dehydrogenase